MPEPAAAEPRPRIWWSPSKRSFYTLLSDEEFTFRQACEPGHEMWTGFKPVPKDAVELAPSSAALARARELEAAAAVAAKWESMGGCYQSTGESVDLAELLDALAEVVGRGKADD